MIDLMNQGAFARSTTDANQHRFSDSPPDQGAFYCDSEIDQDDVTEIE